MRSKILKIIILLLICAFQTVQNTNSEYFDKETSLNNTFQAGCWSNPSIPVLTNPLNDALTNSGNITFTWSSTTFSCPETTPLYYFEIANDNQFNDIIGNGGWGTQLIYNFDNMPQGEYWWRVKVKDSPSTDAHFNESAIYHLIIDRTAPAAKLVISDNSWLKEIGERIDYSNFLTSGAVQTLTQDDIADPIKTIVPYDGSDMTMIGNSSDPGNYLWNNRLMTTFSADVKTLSLYYNFFSRDFGIYDNPGFYIRLNGHEIYRKNSLDGDGVQAENTDWQRFDYDLSDKTGELNLIIYSGNTQGTTTQSWTYIDKITTNYVIANDHAVFAVSGTDSELGIDKCYWKIDSGSWSDSSGFQITDNGLYHIYYYCVDNAGNHSPDYLVKGLIDTEKPDNINDLTFYNITENSVALTWKASGNNGMTGQASRYDIRYQKNCSDINNYNFETAYSIPNISAPQNSNTDEYLDVTGLDKNTDYCFGIKAADQSPNWSDLSNIITVQTLNNADDVNEHDVIINEIMWMGTAAGTDDNYVEFRNTTDRLIDLSGFNLKKYDGSTMIDSGINFTGISIPSHGYLLIVQRNLTDSHLKDDLTAIIQPGLQLLSNPSDPSNSSLYLELIDSDGRTIDEAWNINDTTKEGFYSLANNQYYSMERIATVSDGTDALSWYTCIDKNSSADFFDSTEDVRGTPGAVNRSENEPIITTGPEATINMSEDKKTLSFTVKNISEFVLLSYELTYDTEKGRQGIIGNTDLYRQNEFVRNNIVLGTCSTSKNCTYYLSVTDIRLRVILVDQDENKKEFIVFFRLSDRSS